jgi:hypothetical protein
MKALPYSAQSGLAGQTSEHTQNRLYIDLAQKACCERGEVADFARPKLDCPRQSLPSPPNAPTVSLWSPSLERDRTGGC